MMGPSDLNRVPLALGSSRAEEASRFARLEQLDSDPAWMVPAARTNGARNLRLLQRLGAFLHVTRTPASSPKPAALRPGLAAVHFAGEFTPATGVRHEHVAVERECGLVATTILMSAQPRGAAEDAAACEH